MAVIFMDGFDSYLTADFLRRWTSTTLPTPGNWVISPAAARTPSGQGFQMISNTNAQPPLKSFGVNYTQGLLGFAFNFGGSTTPSRTIFQIVDGTTEQISIRTNASGVLTVTRSGTLLATGSTVLSMNTWYYIELKFTIHASTGVVQLKLNGAAEIASTGSLNTRATANTQWNAIMMMLTNACYGAYIDDVYVIDPTTGSNVDFLGPVRCVALAPAAPGNYAQWTPNGGTNMGCVSEAYQDGDGSFVQSSTANQIDTHVFQDLPASAGSVFAVQHLITARRDEGAARTIRAKQRSGGTDYSGTTQSLSSSYQILTDIKDLNPATAAAWDLAAVNGAEFGFELVS